MSQERVYDIRELAAAGVVAVSQAEMAECPLGVANGRVVDEDEPMGQEVRHGN